jgi:hypothetical protein
VSGKEVELTKAIIGVFYDVYNELGFGLLLNFGLHPQLKRKVYDNDLKPNLQKQET